MNLNQKLAIRTSEEINEIISNGEEWKKSLMYNNMLLEKVEKLLNYICNSYTEEVENNYKEGGEK